MGKLRPAIEPQQKPQPLRYDRMGRRVEEPRTVPFWIGACLVVGAWVVAGVVL